MKKDNIRELKFVVFIRLIVELFDELIQLTQNIGTTKLHKNKNKIEALINKECHSIEKGLSLPTPRVGFGEKKVKNLIIETKNYHKKYPDSPFIKNAILTLKSYSDFNKKNGYENNQIESKIYELSKNIDFNNSKAGVKTVKKEDILNKSLIDFYSFAYSRHSVRIYTKENVSDDIIKKALIIANKTPSACNRQPWHTYIFRGDRKNSLLNFQEGCRGFVESVNTAILVTSDLNCFYINEIHQAYIDGGLYSMSLLYALHSLGIGAIPLTTGFKRKKTRKFYKKFNIPENEVPIVIIGAGHLPETFNVAYSIRKNVNMTNTFIP